MYRCFARSIVPLAVLLSSVVACGDDAKDEGTGSKADPLANEAPVVEQYAKNVHANYVECLDKARVLKTAIDAFIATPSAQTQDAAKAAWVAARLPYGPSEAFRFYSGPIDDEKTGPEGEINSWPLDENFIDYTRDEPTAGIVNRTELALTKESIRGENGIGGEKNIATGYHAIEFLLWGQDEEDTTTKTPGQRSYTDYVSGGSAQNVERRAKYLQLASEILVEDLEVLVAAWEPGKDNFAKTFVADAKGVSVTKMLTAIGSMANAELSGERMTVAYKNRGQEDEHSCFSDTTNADLLGNFVGIQNVYLGKYGSSDGPGIDDLVSAVDPALDARMKSELDAGVAALTALQSVPFDFAIASADGSPERENVLKAIQAIKKTSATIVTIGQTLGVEFKLEEPSEEL